MKQRDLDKYRRCPGCPYDGRIYTTERGKFANGQWGDRLVCVKCAVDGMKLAATAFKGAVDGFKETLIGNDPKVDGEK